MFAGVSIMISKNKFDCFIKKNLVDVIGNDCFGYEIEDKSYDVYDFVIWL